MNAKLQTDQTLLESLDYERTRMATAVRKQLAQDLKDIIWPTAIRLLRESPKNSGKSLGKRIWRRRETELLNVPRRVKVNEQTVINLISRKLHRRELEEKARIEG